MNLKLEKIKRKYLIDYNTFSEYIKKKNGKIIFSQGFRNTVKLNSNKKLSYNEKFERKFQFNSIIKNFNDEFHKKRKNKINKNISIDNKSTTSRIFFPKEKINNYNMLFKNKTTNNFHKTKKIVKKPIRIKSCIYYRNKDLSSFVSSYINSSKKEEIELNNKINYKEIYSEFQRIKNMINNISNSNNKNEMEKNDTLNKSKSSTVISNIDKGKLRFIKKIKNINQKKNKFIFLTSKENVLFNKYLNRTNNYSSKININKNYNEQLNKKYEISSIKDSVAKNYIFMLKNKKAKKNKFSTLEDESKIDLNIFKDYDFNPSKAYYDLKDKFKFFEEDNSNLDSIRINYMWKIRNLLNKNPGIKLKKDFRLSERRISSLKRHYNFK